MLALMIFACSSKLEEDQIRSAVQTQFDIDNPSQTRLTWELKGKGQWYKGIEFDSTCLAENDLAFSKPRSPGYISPVHSAQVFVTGATKRGYCLDLGESLSIDVLSIDDKSAVKKDTYLVKYSFSAKDPSPFFQCLTEKTKVREVMVEGVEKDGAKVAQVIKSNLKFQDGNDCTATQQPQKRTASPRPMSEPPVKLNIEEAKKIAQKFDDLIFEQNFEEVQQMVSCLDLFSDVNQQWGHCALSEFVALGPSTHGDSRPEDGMPWMEGVQYSLNNIKKVVQDKKDKTLFHVIMPHRKSKKDRSFSIQWIDGQWKILGVMSVIGAGITPVRLMNDLHQKDARDIFERRLAGEKINVKGQPLDPNAEKEEESK